MHKPLPGRLINAVLPGPVAMRSALIGVATCAGSVRLPLWVQGVLLVCKRKSGVPGDGAGLEALGAAFGTVSWCWAGWFFTTWRKTQGCSIRAVARTTVPVLGALCLLRWGWKRNRGVLGFGDHPGCDAGGTDSSDWAWRWHL